MKTKLTTMSLPSALVGVENRGWMKKSLVSGPYFLSSLGGLVLAALVLLATASVARAGYCAPVTVGGCTVNNVPGVNCLGTAGHDRIFCTTPTGCVIDGGAGNDFIRGGPGPDTICGGAGSDNIDGRGGADKILGDDVGPGPGFADMVIGAGSDRIIGGLNDGAMDVLYGGEGHDTIRSCDFSATPIGDFIDGGSGNDLLIGDDGPDMITATSTIPPLFSQDKRRKLFMVAQLQT